MPPRNRKDDGASAPGADASHAVDRVLEAERAAEASLEEARHEAARILEAGRDEARRIARRTDARATRVRAWCGERLEAAVEAAKDEEEARTERMARLSRSEDRQRAALERVAAWLVEEDGAGGEVGS